MNRTSADISAREADPLGLPDEDLLGGHCSHGAVGRVNTPAHVARWMAREAVNVLNQGHQTTILEPAAGSGVLVAALVEAMSARRKWAGITTAGLLRRIYAIDSDASVREIAAVRLGRALRTSPNAWLRRQYRVGDSLLDESVLPPKDVDLIIGNPPYLGLRHARRLPAFGRWQKRFGVAEDIYAYFMRWAMETVRPGGHVIFLVPDTWLSLASYEPLRERVLTGRLKHIVRLPGDTFPRQVFPCFFVWQKRPGAKSSVRHTDARRTSVTARAAVDHPPQALFAEAPGHRIFVPSSASRRLSTTWSMLTRRSERITRLGEMANIADVGIHSRNCRHRLFHRQRADRRFERLLQGRQVEPYAVRWDSPKAQYRWVDVHYKPKPNVRGRRRNGTLSHRDEYWDWQGDPEIHKLPERILIRQTGDRIIAARCLQGRTHYFTDNTLFSCTLTDRAVESKLPYSFVLAYLNSRIATDLYRFLSGEEGRTHAQIKVRLLRNLPFVLPSPAAIKRVDAMVRRIEAARSGEKTRLPDQDRLDRRFERLFDEVSTSMLH